MDTTLRKLDKNASKLTIDDFEICLDKIDS